MPYEVVGGAEDYVKVKVGDKEYTPSEISAMILRKLKEAAEAYLGHKVNKAVITVPAYFNDAQRQATKDAGQIAGLEVARIINEPTAASLAYGLDKKGEEKICVFDLGGGTFDVSVLEVADGVFRVISHQRRHAPRRRRLRRSADQLRGRRVQDASRASTSARTTMALQRLQEACEKAKKELSSAQSTDINLPFITADASGPKHLQMTITRAEFEKLVDHLIERVPRPGAAGAERRQARAEQDRRSRARRRFDAHPEGAGGREGALQRQRAAQGREPGRSRGDRRRDPGRRALAAKCRTSCCSTSRRCRWASRPSAA